MSPIWPCHQPSSLPSYASELSPWPPSLWLGSIPRIVTVALNCNSCNARNSPYWQALSLAVQDCFKCGKDHALDWSTSAGPGCCKVNELVSTLPPIFQGIGYYSIKNFFIYLFAFRL